MATPAAPEITTVAVEELRPNDQLFPIPLLVPTDVYEATQKIADEARRRNMYRRDGETIVRRIFLRGRTVEITTQAESMATAPRGTKVAVIRQT